MVAITGATGFVGGAVRDALRMRSIQVITIGRGDAADIRWPVDGATFTRADLEKLQHTRAVVHFAGQNIGVRWTSKRKRLIRSSRVDNTRILSKALASLDGGPATLISASASGYYGDRGDAWLDETASRGSGFLADLVADWEAATDPASAAGVRVVQMRLGVVIGGGGIFGRVRLPFLLGVGGRLGPGTQWLSWIALADLVDFVLRAIDDSAFSGPVNLASPAPVTNAEFTRLMAKVLARPAIIPAPRFALRLAFGEMADALLLTSQRLRPAQLIAHQFGFTHSEMESALRAAAGA